MNLPFEPATAISLAVASPRSPPRPGKPPPPLPSRKPSQSAMKPFLVCSVSKSVISSSSGLIREARSKTYAAHRLSSLPPPSIMICAESSMSDAVLLGDLNFFGKPTPFLRNISILRAYSFSGSMRIAIPKAWPRMRWVTCLWPVKSPASSIMLLIRKSFSSPFRLSLSASNASLSGDGLRYEVCLRLMRIFLVPPSPSSWSISTSSSVSSPSSSLSSSCLSSLSFSSFFSLSSSSSAKANGAGIARQRTNNQITNARGFIFLSIFDLQFMALSAACSQKA